MYTHITNLEWPHAAIYLMHMFSHGLYPNLPTVCNENELTNLKLSIGWSVGKKWQEVTLWNDSASQCDQGSGAIS